MDDWNDARLVLAVSRTGSLTAAAKGLRVNHSTVFRRLASLEARLGLPLFERGLGGTYRPTVAGVRAALSAERMEDEALGMARDLAGLDRRLTGQLRVTCSETLAYRLLTPYIASFRAAQPGIVVELMVDSRALSLSRREADRALRVTRPREGDLQPLQCAIRTADCGSPARARATYGGASSPTWRGPCSAPRNTWGGCSRSFQQQTLAAVPNTSSLGS